MTSMESLALFDSELQPISQKRSCHCITRKDAARLLGIKPKTLDHLTLTGKLKFSRCRISKGLQGYDEAEIIDFLRKFRIEKMCGRYVIVPSSRKQFKFFEGV